MNGSVGHRLKPYKALNQASCSHSPDFIFAPRLIALCIFLPAGNTECEGQYYLLTKQVLGFLSLNFIYKLNGSFFSSSLFLYLIMCS